MYRSISIHIQNVTNLLEVLMMKQSKRMLSVLLAIIMICSTLTIGAQALRTNIDAPIGYDEVLDPVISSDQAARMILDEIEPLLADIDVDEDVAGLKIKIQSVDTLLDTVHNLSDSSLVGFAKLIADLGDIEDLALDAGDVKDHAGNRCRRNNSTSTDFEVLGAVLTFLQTNAKYIAKFAYNGFDFGWLDGLGVFGNDDLAALNDTHDLVTVLLDSLLSGEDFELDIATQYSTDKTITGILQDFIDNKLIKLIVDLTAHDDGTNDIANYIGLNDQLDENGELAHDIPTTQIFPSLTFNAQGEIDETHLGRLLVNETSFYDFIVNIVKAAVRDIVIPLGPDLLMDLVGEDVIQYIDIALPILNLDFTFSEGAEGKQKVDELLRYLLLDGGIKKFFTFKETTYQGIAVKYLSFGDGFWTMLVDILKVVLPMLPPLLGDDCPDFYKTDAELSELTTEQFLTYIIQAVLEKFVDGVEFAKDCDSIAELGTYTLVEVCKDLLPAKDFEQMIENGQLRTDMAGCLKLGAYVIRYYLNGETTIQDNTSDANMSLEAMLNTAADWALDKFGAIFGYDKTKVSANTSVWQKAYDTAFALIPLNLFVGVAPASNGLYKPCVPDSAEGLKNLIIDDILGGVFEFNITEGALDDVGVTGLNKVLSIIGRRSDSELNKPIPQFLMDLVGRLINPLFGLPTERAVEADPSYNQLNLIIPYSYESLDELVTANHNTSTLSLTNTLYRLCLNIDHINGGVGSLFYDGAPFIAQIMGLWGNKDQKYRYSFIPENPPTDFNGGKMYTYDALKALYDEYADESNEGKSYDADDYAYFHMVDFQPFLYLDFKSARSDVRSLLEAYESGEMDDLTFRTEATKAAFQFTTVIRFLEEGYNSDYQASSNGIYSHYGETTAEDYQLRKVLNKANAAGVTQTDNGDGTKTWSDRSWAAYEKALNFANKVEAEYNAAKNSTNSAKALRDMRQSRINEARKQLADALANLKEWVPLADYSMLDSSIEVANYNISLRMYDNKIVQKALAAYLDAVNLDRDYDMDDQFVVDHAQEALDEALAAFNEGMTDYLYLYMDNAGQYIDEDNSYLFGLEEGFANPMILEENGGFDNYMMGYYGMGSSAYGDYLPLGITSTSTGNGTGAVIKMYDFDENDGVTLVNPRKASYTVIVFGDVDGDAYSNAMDSTVLRAYCQLKLTDAQIGAPAVYAADVNESGTVDTKDAKVYESNALMKTFTNQAPDYLTCKTYGIADVLGLREAV